MPASPCRACLPPFLLAPSHRASRVLVEKRPAEPPTIFASQTAQGERGRWWVVLVELGGTGRWYFFVVLVTVGVGAGVGEGVGVGVLERLDAPRCGSRQSRRTLYPSPHTLHPQPYTLHPQPVTLSP